MLARSAARSIAPPPRLPLHLLLPLLPLPLPSLPPVCLQCASAGSTRTPTQRGTGARHTNLGATAGDGGARAGGSDTLNGFAWTDALGPEDLEYLAGTYPLSTLMSRP